MGVRLPIFFIIVLYIFCSGSNDPPGCPDRELQSPQKVYVIGDLHGDFDNTIAILKAAEVLSILEEGKKAEGEEADDGEILRNTKVEAWKPLIKWTGGRNIVVQLGDIADRGPDGPLIFRLFEILKSLATIDGGEIYHLFGNHEGMNLCGDYHGVRVDELRDHFKSDLEKWKEAWSETGYIGKYVRENFEIAEVLFGRLLFIHGGLFPEFAQFTPKDLKDAYLHHIDELKCKRPKMKTGDAPKVERSKKVTNMDLYILKVKELMKVTNMQWDILWGEFSPTWNRELSMARRAEACPLLDRALSAASEWPVVKEQIRTAGVDQFKKMPIHVHKAGRGAFPESVDTGATAKGEKERQEVKLKTMIVGHQPVMMTEFVDESQRDLILRCPKGVTKENSGSSSPYGYLMADAGISRSVFNNIKFLEIDVTFHPNKACCDCPLNVDMDFTQIALNPIEGQTGFSVHRKPLMSHKEP